jgi:catechol 2,3-dioxygenase-like lactoylglutathione lyase family enzyme
MSASISGLHHFTIGCAPGELPALLQFYTQGVGLEKGHRPPLRHPGHWLYCGGRAILHLNALHPEQHPVYGLGSVDHVSFRAHGLDATRAALLAAGISFTEIPLAGTDLHQLFLHDPLGTKVELTFDMLAER